MASSKQKSREAIERNRVPAEAKRYTGPRQPAGTAMPDRPLKKISGSKAPGILAIDIGGSGLKAAVIDEQGKMISEHLRVSTPNPCPPEIMLQTLGQLIAPLSGYNRISVGFPGVIRGGVVLTAANLGREVWYGFDLGAALSRQFGNLPTKVINDADMQGYALITGEGLELVLTLGTGFGSALYLNGELMPHMELGQHIARGKKTYDLWVGNIERERIGHAKWEKRILKTLEAVHVLLHPDLIHLGGGNASRLSAELPSTVRVGSNDAGLLGGAALWRAAMPVAPERKAKSGAVSSERQPASRIVKAKPARRAAGERAKS